MTPAITLATALGYDLRAAAELLPSGLDGVRAAINRRLKEETET